MAKLPSSKPAVFRPVKPARVTPMAPPPANPEQAILKQLATKPVVKPVRVSGRALVRPPADALKPPKVAESPVYAPKAPKALNTPLKSYLPS